MTVIKPHAHVQDRSHTLWIILAWCCMQCDGSSRGMMKIALLEPYCSEDTLNYKPDFQWTI